MGIAVPCKLIIRKELKIDKPTKWQGGEKYKSIRLDVSRTYNFRNKFIHKIMEKNKTRGSFEGNKGRSFDYKISDIWIYKSFDFFEGNCLFWNLVVGFKRSVKMFQKTFEVLQAIDDLATEYYEKIKTDCDTYEDLEKGLRGMSYVDFGRFNTSRDYLVKVMRQKIEKEKSSLHIIKQEEKVVSVDKIAKHLVKRLNEI